MNELYYDIIADIHGRFDKLTALMERLGYQPAADGFIPPAGHRALFLGDLIDTKPGYPFPGGVHATLRAVKAMCDRGDALCLMGNHEFNAICFHTKGPDGEWLKIRGEGIIRTHLGTLEDFPDYADPASEWSTVWMPWMKSLPVALDLGGFRAVHACLHPAHLPVLLEGNFEDYDFLVASADKSSPEGMAVEAVLKGIEVSLPEGSSFTTSVGSTKHEIRVRWWELPDSGIGYDGLVFPINPSIPSDPVSAESFAQIPGYPLDASPVFFGHYLKPADSPSYPERHNVACLDHAAATGGPLVAYRYKGESHIKPENYVSQF